MKMNKADALSHAESMKVLSSIRGSLRHMTGIYDLEDLMTELQLVIEESKLRKDELEEEEALAEEQAGEVRMTSEGEHYRSGEFSKF